MRLNDGTTRRTYRLVVVLSPGDGGAGLGDGDVVGDVRPVVPDVRFALVNENCVQTVGML